MIQRVLTALVGVPLVLAAVLFLPSRWFFVAVLVVMELAAVEYVGLFRRRLPDAPLGVLIGLVPLVALLLRPDLLLGSAAVADQRLLLSVGLLLTVGLGSLVLAGSSPVEQSAAALGVLAFGVPYLVVPLLSLLWLHEMGSRYVFLLLAVVWVCDSAAFFVGSRFGRRKLAPRISPAKSWEGLIGGVAGAGLVIGAWWMLAPAAAEGVVSVPAGWPGWAAGVGLTLLAVVTALATVFGDLTESLLKRSEGVKDTGRILPGHGGILDRIDGLIFAAPIWVLGISLLR